MICKNGYEHTHTTVYESKLCWGVIRPPAPPVVVDPNAWKTRPGSMTDSQKRYLIKLGATKSELYGLSCNDASALIDDYKSGAKMHDSRQPEDPRLTMAKAMFDMVPDGYYAVALAGEPLKFFRVTTIKKQRGRGLPAGTRKIDTQHSDDWATRLTIYPSGQWHQRPGFSLDDVMLLVTDYEEAAYLYGNKIGSCCRCNKTLTDERSRHYAIGPECEKHSPWMIEKVDLKHDGQTYEQLLVAGRVR